MWDIDTGVFLKPEDNLAENRLFGREIGVEAPIGNPSGPGDVDNPRVEEALSLEDSPGGPDERLAGAAASVGRRLGE
jgi:hypothetical protein